MFDLVRALNDLADIFILISFVLMVVFTTSYMVFFLWRKTKAGRAILFTFSALLVVTLLSLLSRWIGQDYWMREWFRAIGWFLVTIAVLNLVRVLWWNFLSNATPLSLETRTQPTDVVE